MPTSPAATEDHDVTPRKWDGIAVAGFKAKDSDSAEHFVLDSEDKIVACARNAQVAQVIARLLKSNWGSFYDDRTVGKYTIHPSGRMGYVILDANGQIIARSGDARVAELIAKELSEKEDLVLSGQEVETPESQTHGDMRYWRCLACHSWFPEQRKGFYYCTECWYPHDDYPDDEPLRCWDCNCLLPYSYPSVQDDKGDIYCQECHAKCFGHEIWMEWP